MTNNEGTWFDTVFRPMVERYKGQHRQRNIWLNPMEPDIKTRPKLGFGRIPRTDAAGLRAEISTIMDNVLDPHTGYVSQYGRLPYREMKLKEKRADIERLARAKGFKGKTVQPTGRQLEDLAELTALKELEEETSRLLHKMLKEKEAEEKAVEIGRRRKVGCVKLKDGQPWAVDGRELVQTDNGEFMLADTGQMLKDYQAEVTANRKRTVERKRAADAAAHACAAC